jgi:hypothetical protein
MTRITVCAVAAAAAAAMLCGCQINQPDPTAINELGLAAIEDSLPEASVRMIDPERRAERAIFADRIVQMPDDQEADPVQNARSLATLEFRFSTWCQKESLQPRGDSYPYGRATLTKDIQTIAGFELTERSPLLICMGQNGQSLVGAYVVLTDRRVAFYSEDDARRLRLFLMRHQARSQGTE